MKKISAVIPVYNAEQHLGKCIESIRSQTYNNWEAVFVDDGSTDNSYEILQHYSSIDSRISVIHQENSGPGCARNNGLSYVTGDYIVFIDSDDYISSDYYFKLSLHNEDVVFIDLVAVNERGEKVRKEYMSGYRTLSYDAFIRSQLTGKISWGGCRKAVKSELLKNNKIEYSNHLNGEEALFSFKVLLYANSISFLDSPVYYYVQSPDSLSHIKIEDPWGDVVKVIKKFTIEHEIYKMYANTINAFFLTAAAVSCDRLSQKYEWQVLKKKLSEKVDDLKSNIDWTFPIDYCNMSFKAKILGYLLLHRHYKAVWILCKLKSIIL